MKTRLATLALLALFVPVLTGCGKEPLAPQPQANQPPPLPPASSMNFDFGFFEQRGAAATAAAHPNGAEATLDRSNWINAVVRVVYLNLTVADLFSAPALAMNAALSQTPVLGDDGWFTWSYSFADSGRTISLRLRARIDGGTVTWRMYATDPGATPVLADFLWFSGESHLTNDRGFWVFNDSRASGPVAVARIDWDATAADRRSLSFRNVENGSPDFGDSLSYGVVGATVSVVFHDASENQDADITWNERTGEGSLQVPDYNGGQRACWDSRQENATCPAAPAL